LIPEVKKGTKKTIRKYGRDPTLKGGEQTNKKRALAPEKKR
jgi:hypothetical protein